MRVNKVQSILLFERSSSFGISAFLSAVFLVLAGVGQSLENTVKVFPAQASRTLGQTLVLDPEDTPRKWLTNVIIFKSTKQKVVA